VEAPFPVREHVREVELLYPGHVLTDQFPEVTLASHEADDGDRAIRLASLDQLHQLVPLGLDEADVGRVRGQPEDQLIEEQDQCVVTKRLCVGADDAEPHVEINIGFVLTLSDPPEGGEDELDEIAHQPSSLFAGGRGFQGRLETGCIPARGKLAPA